MSQTLPDQPSLAEEQRSQPLLESTSEEIGSGMWRGRTEGRRRKVSYILSPSLMKTSDKLPSNRGRSTLVHSLTFHLDLLDLETLQEAISEDEQGFSDDGYGEGDPDEDRDRDRRSEKFAEFLKSLGFDEEGGHPLGRIASRGESNGGASLEFPRGAEDPAELGPRSNLNRAKVVRPERASKERLESYHTRRFVEKLLSGKVIQTNDADPSRRKRSRVDPNGSNVSKGFDGSASRGRGFRGGREYEGFGGEDSDSTLTEQDDSEDEDESLEMKQDDMIRLRSSSIVGGRKRMRGYKKRKVTNQFGLQDDCPPFKGLDEHVKLIAGASITAAEEIASGRADVAIAWDGGRHHAKKDAASGFCYINDIVLAILALRKPRKVKVEVEDIEEDHGGTRMDDAKVKEEGRVTDGSSAKGDGFHPDKKSKEEGLTGVEDAKTVPTADQTPTVENGKTPKVPSRPTTVVKRIERVLYIDIDLHWGDGVEEAFYNSPNVLTLSLHHYSKGFFPCYSDSRDPEDPTVGPPGSRDSSGGPKNDPKAASKALSLPLLAGLSGENLERVIKTCVEPVFKAYDPEVLVIQCGLDGLAGDPMSIWNLDCRSVLKVISTFLSWDLPTLLLGGGGYDNVNAAKCWSLITSLALGRLEMSDLEEEQDRDEASLGSGNSLVKARGNEADDKEFARENGRHTETEPTLSEEGEGMKVDLVEIADKGLDALEEGVEMQVAAVESKGLDRNADGSKAKGGQGRLDKISLSTPVPFHEFWDRYSRDPILDVRRGEMKDTNDEAYLLELEAIFDRHCRVILKSTKEHG